MGIVESQTGVVSFLTPELYYKKTYEGQMFMFFVI